jgi:hypothetical protein
MKTKTKTFDAVRESRRWKESVVQRTAGMNRAEVLEFFNGARSVAPQRHEPLEESSVLREDAPKT